MIGLTNAGGGGGSDLNFSVIGSPTQPVAPKYNDIWVKTSVKIPDWEFSEVNMPSHAMSEGFVYFTSTYSGAWAARESTGLNFLRKHAILTKLTAACQYYSGAWHSMDAYIYKSGTWVQFSWSVVSLYNNGAWNTDLTGEWIAQGKLLASQSNPALTPKVAKNADNFKVYYTSSDNGSGIYYAAQKINLSNFKTLHFEGEMRYYQDSYGTVGLNVWTNINGRVDQNRSAVLHGNGVASGVGTLDVSALTGDYYIGFNVYANYGVGTSSVVCKKLYLT